MKVDKGTLKKVKTGFRVILPTKNGSADFPIPENAVYFRAEDAEDGLEVDVERDAKNRITKVTVPGKQVMAPPSTGAHPGPVNRGEKGPGTSQPVAVRGMKKAHPQVIGLPFHIPYTFLPFGAKRTRKPPTELSVDELELQRVTGILELEVTTQSPLLSCHSTPIREEHGHKSYAALTIGDDVIVPATGIRGALRTLLTVLTGGTLGYMNEHAYLCQGRDVQLGPRGKYGPASKPANVFLAEVVQPGSSFRDGKIQLGQTRLVRLTDLERINQRPLPRGDRGPTLWVELDTHGNPTAITTKQSHQTPWKLKVSGRPVGGRRILEKKREGAFLPDGPTIDLPSSFWEAYSGRNVHGDRPELRKHDLIWLEPTDPDAVEIKDESDIASIQWARWGKRGQRLIDDKVVPRHIWPDAMQEGDDVDEVTNLFGQVPGRGQKATSFAARIRPENLVFLDAKSRVVVEHLAPLAPPHPGCMAFYRDNDNPDDVSVEDGLRGYKVYRTSQERGEDAPWKFSAQGVYDDFGNLKSPTQKVNKTCELLPDGCTGTLRIAFRALSRRELALLLLACTVPWRIGGGKPLSLGLCHVRLARILDEFGKDMEFNAPGFEGWKANTVEGVLAITGWQDDVSELAPRVTMWRESQRPVKRMRYPRAVNRNNNKNARGGHSWFQRHAAPRMVSAGDDGQREPGIGPMYIDGELKQLVRDLSDDASEPFDPAMPMIAGQILPKFAADNPESDVLYGYDGIVTDSYQTDNRRTVVKKIEEFEPAQHVSGREKSEGTHGKDATFRKEQKHRRDR